MSILPADILFFAPAVVADGPTNGGVLTGIQYVSGSPNNIWPNALQAERDAGSTLARKLFGKAHSDTVDSLVGAGVYNFDITPGDDYVKLYPGTQRDTEADRVTSRYYAASRTTSTLTAGVSTTVVVDVEDASIAAGAFQDGDKIIIHDKITPGAVAGNKEYHTINGVPVVVDDQVTITLTTAVTNGFAIGSKVCSILEGGTLTASLDNVVVTSVSGTFDDTGFPPVMNNQGTKEEEITFTITGSGTTFTVVSDVDGAMASGAIASDYAPVNALFGVEKFTLPAGIFAGTYLDGDTIVLETHPCTLPHWLDRVIPALSSSLDANLNETVMIGESA